MARKLVSKAARRRDTLPVPEGAIACRIPEACALTGLQRTTMFAAIRDGRVKAWEAGRATLISVESLRTMIEALPAFGETVDR